MGTQNEQEKSNDCGLKCSISMRLSLPTGI